MLKILRKIFAITDRLGWYWVRAAVCYVVYKSYLRANKIIRAPSELSREFEKNRAIKFESLIDPNTVEKVKEILKKNAPMPSRNKWVVEWKYDPEIDALLSEKLQPIIEIAETVAQARLPNNLEETTIYQTIPQENIGSSYLWHHDGHFSRYKIMVLFTDADESSALKIDLGTHKDNRMCVSYECSRYLDYKPRNLFVCSGKAGDVFLFDTSTIHQAGNPDPANPRIVATLCLGDSSAYMI